MDKTFDPSSVEARLYQNWEKSGYFKPNGDKNAESYCIMIPPPNVTGSLHLGHAFQHTLMDTLIRYQRMQGKNTLWQVGCDHAGIATQMVVERKLAAENGPTRHQLGRDAFIEKIWEWKNQSGSTITGQMRRLGNSVDWDRERFTMDEGLSNAVREVFVRLHEQGLMYRGKRLVNWDPKLHTAISDLEVENHNKQGSMWYLRYPLADGATTAEGKNYIVIATTRPETLLGDVAVMVHPDDARYNALVGQEIDLPLCSRRIPIIADEHVDMEFGTGCVKVTPAHDFNDYEVGQRHQLPLINVLTTDATVRPVAQVFAHTAEVASATELALPEAYHNQDRYVARKQLVADLDAQGLLEKVTPHALVLPMGDRSGVVIEPMLMDQWYVRVEPLAQKAVAAVENGDISFVPKQYENMFFAWMRDVQDWCVSRQLWWGHRIPAWYDAEGNIYVGRSEDEVRRKHHLGDIALTQDEDVLDTWFSSALWTFSTLGWPEKTPDFLTFHPTQVLVSGFDIIFFWIARMMMMTLNFVENEAGVPEIPFKDIYITGLIRDEEGQKMSKSKGNVLDPMDMIDGIALDDLVAKRTANLMQPKLAEKIAKRTRKQFPEGIKPHGSDALRFTLASMASASRDLNWDMSRLESSRNFCNKIWNAARYVLSNLEQENDQFIKLSRPTTEQLGLADRWIETKFQQTVAQVHDALEQYRFDLAAQAIYEFFWHQFCDWYLELTKPVLWNGTETEKQAARYTLVHMLESVLRLAHPMIPFVTEEIWQQIAPIILDEPAPSIMVASYPKAEDYQSDFAGLADQEWINLVIMAVRNLRAEMSVAPSKPIPVLLKATEIDQKRALANKAIIMKLAKLDAMDIVAEGEKLPPASSALVGESEVYLPFAGVMDVAAECQRLEKELQRLQGEKTQLEGKLSNESFVSKAPEVVVDKARDQLNSIGISLEKVRKQYAQIREL